MAQGRDSSGRFVGGGARVGTGVTFVINPVALAQFMRGPDGPVVRDLLRRGDQLIALAKRQVGVGQSPETGSISGAGGRAQPHLRDTIVKRIDVSDVRGPKVFVGSDAAPKALYHHEGTRPHVIVPRVKHVLRFVTRQGGVVFTKRVNHPGTKPNRYLTDNLPRVMD